MKKSKIIALTLVGAAILVGTAFATAAWATPRWPGAYTAAQSAAVTNEAELRAAILEMLEDHMGLTGDDAEQWADQMLSHMWNVDSDADFGAMIEGCQQFMDGRGYEPGAFGPRSGGGMMGGGYGMMGGGGRP